MRNNKCLLFFFLISASFSSIWLFQTFQWRLFQRKHGTLVFPSLSTSSSAALTGYSARSNQIKTQNSSKFSITVWTALCDTRTSDDGLNTLIIYVLTSKRFGYKTHGKMFSCSAFDVDGSPVDYVKYSRFYIRYSTFMLLCPFKAQFQCPHYAAVRTDKGLQTRQVPVERQIQPITGQGKSRSNRLAICLPAISNYSIDPLAMERVVEWFEYYKLFGVATVYQPVLSLKKHPLYPSKDLLKTWKYYESTGVLQLYKAIAHPTRRIKKMFWEIRESRGLHASYCLTKYALIHEFIAYQDHDEIFAYDWHKYSNFWQVLSELREKYWKNIGAVRVRDTPISNNCYKAKNQVNYSAFVFPQIHEISEQRLNNGKSIYQADSCYMQEPHRCILKRTKGQLKEKGEIRAPIWGGKGMPGYGGHFIDINQNNTNLLRSFHYRTPFNPGGGKSKLGRQKWCKNSHFKRTNWLDPIMPQLSKKSLETVKALKNAPVENQLWKW